METTNPDDANRQADILHNVHLGIRYHARREAFFARLHRTTGVISLIASSAAFALFWRNSPRVGAIAAAVVAVVQAFDLWCGWAERATLHADLRRRYVTLAPDVDAHNGMDLAIHAAFRRRIAAIEIDEPPVHATLIELCQNEAATVDGYTPRDNPATFTTLGFWRSRFPNVL